MTLSRYTPSQCHSVSAAFLNDKAMMRRAYELWKHLSEKHPEYGKYRDKAEKLSR